MTLEDARSAGSAGALDLYRAVWAAGRSFMDRPWMRPAIASGFVAVWLLLRMLGGLPLADVVWSAAAIAVAVLSPGTGLVILAGVAPWDEPLTLGHALGLRSLLVLALGISVGLRVLIKPRSMPRTMPVLAAAGLLVVSLVLGVGQVYVRSGRSIGWDTATFWLAGFGGAMIVLLAAIWIGAQGHRAALWAAVAVALAAGLLSLADYVLPGVMRGLFVQGILADKTFGNRLAGAIASPNAMVSMLVAPTAILAAAAMRARDPRIKALLWLAIAGLSVALLLTYSRSAIIALFVIVVILAWRWRRRIGIALFVVGMVIGIAATPAYLSARGNVIGGSSEVTPGKILIATDVQRLDAWSAASAMWLDQPLTGFGFRSYKYLGPDYGDAILGSPHDEWIRLFAEEGIVGGLLGIGLLVALGRDLARGRDWLAYGAFGAFAGWAITASFNNPFLFVQVNAIVFTIVGVALGLGVAESAGAADQTAERAADDGVAAVPPSPARAI